MPHFTTAVANGAPVRLGRAARLLVPTLFAGALVAAGCGNNTPTISSVTRATIEITVDPNPITATQDATTLVATATYKITLTETAGLGGEVQSISSAVYDPATGKQVALNFYDSTDLVVYQGGKRIEPNGQMVLPQSSSYTLSDYTKAANLVVTVQFKDDRTNLDYSSLLVKIQ